MESSDLRFFSSVTFSCVTIASITGCANAEPEPDVVYLKKEPDVVKKEPDVV